MRRAPLEESRKWAIYYTTNLLFKTYFKVPYPFADIFLIVHANLMYTAEPDWPLEEHPPRTTCVQNRHAGIGNVP